VRFGDTDPYGVVYFISYFKYAHQALENFLLHRGIKPSDIFRNREKNLGLPIVASSGDFKKPLFYEDEFDVYIKVMKKGNSSITFSCEFKKENTLIAEIKMTMVAIDRNWEPRKLPCELEALEAENG